MTRSPRNPNRPNRSDGADRPDGRGRTGGPGRPARTSRTSDSEQRPGAGPRGGKPLGANSGRPQRDKPRDTRREKPASGTAEHFNKRDQEFTRPARPARPRRTGRDAGDASHGAVASGNMLWGYHTIREALRSPKRHINALYASAPAAERLKSEIAEKKLTPVILEPSEIDRMLPAGAVHQGLAARIEPLPQPDLSELPDDGFVLVLDQVTDPHNLGAIIRSAAAFNVSAIVMTDRNAPSLAGIVAKSASGGLEHVPVITVVNLARAMEELGRLGYWRVGLDSDGEAAMQATRLERPLALALGAEGKGLRRLTRENCDVITRLDMPGAIKSLNVSNACAVALALVSSKTQS